MQSKVAIALVAFLAVTTGIGLVYFRLVRESPDSSPADAEAQFQTPVASSNQPPARPTELHPNASTAPVRPAGRQTAVPSASVALATSASAEFVSQRSAELAALAMNDDVNSLNTILSELTNPDRAIRKAALDATIQFGDHSATARLQQVANQLTDPGERVQLQQAIEYLNLPSLTEYRAAQGIPVRASGPTNPRRTPGIGNKSVLPPSAAPPVSQ